MPERVVLAYSGGLDTSIIIPWLKENYSYDVIAMVGDVGQGDDIEAVVEKAHKTGASKVVVEDLREEFLTGYVFPALKAGAKRQRPGSIRAGISSFGAGTQDHCAVAGMEFEVARRLSRLRREARHSRYGKPGEDSQPRSQSLAHPP